VKREWSSAKDYGDISVIAFTLHVKFISFGFVEFKPSLKINKD